jgi:hypothetical protein
VKRRLSGLAVSLIALTVVSVRPGRAATTPTFDFKSLFTVDQPLGDTGETPTNGEIEDGGVNKDGTATGVVNWGDGEGAFLVTIDGKNSLVLSKTDLDNPAGGKFGNGINNKVSINDAGNVAFTVTNDRGDGATDETFFVDRTDPAKPKWTSVVKAGMVLAGGKVNNAVSFATISNANDVVFTAAHDSGTGTYIWNAGTGQIDPVCPPGTKVGSNTISNARRVQIALTARIVTFEAQVDGDDNFGAYMWKDGAITELVRWNTPAPDAAGKATGSNFDEMRGPIANANGDVAMLGHTDAGWGVYLWTAKDQKLVRIVGPGDTVDGAAINQVAFSFRNDIRFGDDGSILFVARFDDQDQGPRGLYLRQPDGTLVTLAKTGQDLKGIGKVDVLQGDIGGDSGLGLSTDGKITFPVTTDDGKRQLVLAIPAAAPTAGE